MLRKIRPFNNNGERVTVFPWAISNFSELPKTSVHKFCKNPFPSKACFNLKKNNDFCLSKKIFLLDFSPRIFSLISGIWRNERLLGGYSVTWDNNFFPYGLDVNQLKQPKKNFELLFNLIKFCNFKACFYHENFLSENVKRKRKFI